MKLSSGILSQEEINALLEGRNNTKKEAQVKEIENSPSHSTPQKEKIEARMVKFSDLKETKEDREVYTKTKTKWLSDIPVWFEVRLGEANFKMSELLGFKKGTVLVLDKAEGEHADIFVNDLRIGSGEVVVVDSNLGVRLVNLG